jgi:hypothetical protein
MGLLEDFNKLKGDPMFQRLVARVLTESPEVVEQLLASCRDLPELAPASPKEGKKFIAERDKVTIMIDSALLELIEETATSLAVPISRVVETAVWQFYHRPALSFQKESNDDTEK